MKSTQTNDTPTDQDTLPFLKGGGEMERRMRDHDWSASPLGSPETWPLSLRSNVALMLNSRFGMFLAWGPELGFLYNDHYARIIADKHPAALGRRFQDVWAEAWEPLKPLIDQALSGDAVYFEDMPLVMNRKGFDEETWWTFSYSPVRDDDGEIAGVFCATHEATRKVLGERRDAAIKARQQQLFEQTPSFIVTMTGPEHRVNFVNDAHRALFGSDDWVGKTIRDAFPSLADEGFFSILDAVYLRGETFQASAAEVRYQRAPDLPFETHYMTFVYAPVVEPDGSISGVFCEGFDLTEQVAATEALAASEAGLRQLNETLEQRVEERSRALEDSREFTRLALSAVGGVGVWTYEVAQNLFFCDAAISALYDIDPEAGAAGLPPAGFLANLHPADVEPLKAVMTGGLLSQGDLELEYRIRHSDGSVRHVLSRGYTYFEDGKPVRRTGVGIDMTRQRLLEEQLRQAQKMEAVGQLTGGIAHDFNNLLAGISGSLELLQKRLDQGRFADLERYIEGAQGASRRAAALTQRLLAFSRRQTLDPKPTDVNRLVAGMEDLVRRSIGPTVELEVVQAGGLWNSLVDGSQLENALLNLCINARDAMPDGGRITIETANRTLDAPTAQTYELTPGDFLSICVSDTGTGMPADVVARAFDPFFTTKPLGQGTGLGLSMIYGFVRQSGGQVRISTELGQGTTLCLYLPRYRGEAEAPMDADGAVPLEQGAGETVLVIDDEPTVRALIVDVLNEAGYRVLEADDGPSGLAILQSAARIDLLVTDVGLPGGMNGRQVADAARTTRAGLRVLFVTGYAENAAVGNGQLDPGMEVITKPFAMTALTSKVSEILDRPDA
jgi:signal transduction histidine kinase